MELAISVIGLVTALVTLIVAISERVKGGRDGQKEKRAGSAAVDPLPSVRHRKRSVIASGASVVILVITAVLVFVVVPASRPDPVVSVILPGNGSVVPFQNTIVARAEHIDGDHQIWPMVHEIGAKYHPGDKPCAVEAPRTGDLSCPLIYVGSNNRTSAGKSFTILFCYADASVQQQFLDYDRYVKGSNDYSGFDHLWAVDVIGRVDVVRK